MRGGASRKKKEWKRERGRGLEEIRKERNKERNKGRMKKRELQRERYIKEEKKILNGELEEMRIGPIKYKNPWIPFWYADRMRMTLRERTHTGGQLRKGKKLSNFFSAKMELETFNIRVVLLHATELKGYSSHHPNMMVFTSLSSNWKEF